MKKDILDKIKTYPNWYRRVRLADGYETPGINDSNAVLSQLDLPLNLTGKRILDIGARDGYFSFECERRGAKVIAVDIFPYKDSGLHLLQEFFNSSLLYIQANIYDLKPERFGKFDYILCLGLLYHLRNPIRAIEQIRELARNRVIFESFVIDDFLSKYFSEEIAQSLSEKPINWFFSKDQFNKDDSNWSGMTRVCLREILESTNFTVVRDFYSGGKERSIFDCKINNDQLCRALRYSERNLLSLDPRI